MTSFVVLTGALAAVGVTNSALQRALTNEPQWFGVAVAAMLAALCLGALAVALKGKGSQGVVCIAGLVLFYGGGLGLFTAVSQSEYTRERPSIVTTLNKDAETGKETLRVSVSADRLLAKDYINATVFGVVGEGSSAGAYYYLYEAQTGPGRDGKFNLDFDVEFQRADFASLQVRVVRVEDLDDPDAQPNISCGSYSTAMSCTNIYLTPKKLSEVGRKESPTPVPGQTK